MAKRKYKLNEILEIVWDDAATVQGWHSASAKGLVNNGGLSRSNTVGYFLRQTKGTIQISKCRAEDGDRADTQAIPTSTIRKIKRLR